MFPDILGSVRSAGVLFNFSTMNPNMQNAYSEQGSFEIEQQLGRSSTLSVGYQHVRGLHLIISVNQNVPTCTACGHQQRLPPESDLSAMTASILRWRIPTTTACMFRSSSGP